MPKICPCLPDLDNPQFCFYILLIDMFIGFTIQFGFVLPLVGIIIYLKMRNFNSTFFNFYFWYRVIIPVLLIIGYIGLIVGVSNFEDDDEDDDDFFLKSNKHFKEHKKRFNWESILIATILYALIIAWLFYTSFNYKNAIK